MCSCQGIAASRQEAPARQVLNLHSVSEEIFEIPRRLVAERRARTLWPGAKGGGSCEASAPGPGSAALLVPAGSSGARPLELNEKDLA